ncbi:hypothetical protein NADFUDRAFT_81948 [Nadsonia fulvescens var. elongata DSM 6958]|uniref:Uncharacterized protein n=1 Tax=Nadsonia fulvescens var. elongata DSM 6958 TaxID=857566 RepID=A0A1E3PPW6_9ASCO|nr:hypothetical protein NADFUDRAFT_81948 [Nadsonia fulvescens var. elongata DSM 6958]
MEFCYRNEIKLISSMGAACKGDPSSVRICDISQSLEDSLSRTCRRKLKPKGISNGIQVVFSTEKPPNADSNSGSGSGKASLMPLAEEEFLKGNVDELGVLNRFRVRILPVLGTMPGLFGLNMANHVVLEIANPKLVPEYVLGRFGLKFYDTPLQGLLGQLQRLGYGEVRVPWNLEDIMFLVEEVFRGKSVISGSTNRINLSMWAKGAGYDRDNIVVMTKEEQRKHEDLVLKKGMSVEEVYRKSVCDLAESRLHDVKWYEHYR